MIWSIRETLMNIQDVSYVTSYLLLLFAVGVWFYNYVCREADKSLRGIDADVCRTIDEYRNTQYGENTQDSD